MRRGSTVQAVSSLAVTYVKRTHKRYTKLAFSCQRCLPVPLVDQLEAGQRQVGVDVADVFRAAGDQGRLAAGGDDPLDVGDLGQQALEDAVDEADVAVVDAGLHGGGGVAADQLGGLADVHPVETRGVREEGFGRDADPGRDDPPHVLPRRVDHVEGGGGAEVDHDHRR